MVIIELRSIRLISIGKSTLEFCEKKQLSKYNFGIYGNLKRTLGTNIIYWFVPICNLPSLSSLVLYIYYQFRSLRRGRRIGLQMKDLSYFSLFFNVLFWMIICNVWGLRSPQLRVLRLYLVFVKCVWLDKASLSLL